MIDAIDKKIIYEVSKHARIPVNHLAKSIRLSVTATKNRLDNLYKDKIILSTHPIIDIYKLGFHGTRIYFSFFGTLPEKEKEIIEWLVNHPTIGVVGETTGVFNVVLHSWTKDINIVQDFILEFKQKYRKEITNLEFFIYLKTYHFSRDYLLEKSESQMIVTGENTRYEIDELDVKIIKSLLEDARKSVVKIAQELNESSRTVTFRLKQLEKKRIIMGYGANIDLEKIGYEYYKMNLILNENINYQKLVNFSKNLKSSIFIDQTIGKYDFELNVEVKNRNEFNKVVEQLKEITGGIRSIEITQLKRYYKFHYINF